MMEKFLMFLKKVILDEFYVLLNISQVNSRQSKFFLLFAKTFIGNSGLKKFLLLFYIKDN